MRQNNLLSLFVNYFLSFYSGLCSTIGLGLVTKWNYNSSRILTLKEFFLWNRARGARERKSSAQLHFLLKMEGFQKYQSLKNPDLFQPFGNIFPIGSNSGSEFSSRSICSSSPAANVHSFAYPEAANLYLKDNQTYIQVYDKCISASAVWWLSRSPEGLSGGPRLLGWIMISLMSRYEIWLF